MDELQTSDLHCLKYNYSLDDEVQNFSSFESTIRLSEDYKQILITNKKPVPADVFVKEKDPKKVQRAKYISKLEQIEMKRGGKSEEKVKKSV